MLTTFMIFIIIILLLFLFNITLGVMIIHRTNKLAKNCGIKLTISNLQVLQEIFFDMANPISLTILSIKRVLTSKRILKTTIFTLIYELDKENSLFEVINNITYNKIVKMLKKETEAYYAKCGKH